MFSLAEATSSMSIWAISDDTEPRFYPREDYPLNPKIDLIDYWKYTKKNTN